MNNTSMNMITMCSHKTQVSRFISGYASLIPSLIHRLSCVWGEPGNEATALHDQVVAVNTQNADKLISVIHTLLI